MTLRKHLAARRLAQICEHDVHSEQRRFTCATGHLREIAPPRYMRRGRRSHLFIIGSYTIAVRQVAVTQHHSEWPLNVDVRLIDRVYLPSSN